MTAFRRSCECEILRVTQKQGRMLKYKTSVITGGTFFTPAEKLDAVASLICKLEDVEHKIQAFPI